MVSREGRGGGGGGASGICFLSQMVAHECIDRGNQGSGTLLSCGCVCTCGTLQLFFYCLKFNMALHRICYETEIATLDSNFRETTGTVPILLINHVFPSLRCSVAVGDCNPIFID